MPHSRTPPKIRIFLRVHLFFQPSPEDETIQATTAAGVRGSRDRGACIGGGLGPRERDLELEEGKGPRGRALRVARSPRAGRNGGAARDGRAHAQVLLMTLSDAERDWAPVDYLCCRCGVASLDRGHGPAPNRITVRRAPLTCSRASGASSGELRPRRTLQPTDVSISYLNHPRGER